jgi:hypothetical protein
MDPLNSQLRPALVGAAIAVLIVAIALVGLARLVPDQQTPPLQAPVRATETVAEASAELVAGRVVFDDAALAAERRRDFTGSLLAFFAASAALGGLACAGWAGSIVWRATRAPRSEPSAPPQDELARGR